jgi:predicted hydrocarbon binding protein
MNRILLEGMLKKMKLLLENGTNIGDLKIGALYALGNQLEAIFYFIGHELGSTMDEDTLEKTNLVEALKKVTEKYHLGVFHFIEENSDHITFGLEHCSSCKDIDIPKIKIQQGFCSFEAGLFAGIVEKMTGKHCFAQELECRLSGDEASMCKFMIVIPND